MGMPNNLVLVRHGESEANVAQRLEKRGECDKIPKAFYDRHDWQHRLSEKGVGQAEAAGRWILENLGSIDAYFDRRYVSPFIRTRETALHLGGLGLENWLKDDRLIERSWGTYGATPFDVRAEQFPHTERQRAGSTLYSHMDNGESIGYGTVFRVRNWLDTLHRDMDGKNALAVTHGEFMWSVRFALEGMLPEEWDQNDSDKQQKMWNCTVLHYTRVNPEDPEDIRPALNWRRLIYPTNVARSPFNGEWRPINAKRYMPAAELQASIDAVPRLLG